MAVRAVALREAAAAALGGVLRGLFDLFLLNRPVSRSAQSSQPISTHLKRLIHARRVQQRMHAGCCPTAWASRRIHAAAHQLCCFRAAPHIAPHTSPAARLQLSHVRVGGVCYQLCLPVAYQALKTCTAEALLCLLVQPGCSGCWAGLPATAAGRLHMLPSDCKCWDGLLT